MCFRNRVFLIFPFRVTFCSKAISYTIKSRDYICQSLNSTSVAHEPNTATARSFSPVIAIRFVPPTANFIYPPEKSRIFYDTSEGVATRKLDAFGGKSRLPVLGKITPLRSQDEAILSGEVSDSDLCRIFLKEQGEASNEHMTCAFCQSVKVGKGFSQEALASFYVF